MFQVIAKALATDQPVKAYDPALKFYSGVPVIARLPHATWADPQLAGQLRSDNRLRMEFGISLVFGHWDLELSAIGFPFDSRFLRWQGVGSI